MQVKLQFQIADKANTNLKLADTINYDNEKATYDLNALFDEFRLKVIDCINTFEGMGYTTKPEKEEKGEVKPHEREQN